MTFFSRVAEWFKKLLIFLGLSSPSKPYRQEDVEQLISSTCPDELDGKKRRGNEEFSAPTTPPNCAEHKGSLRFSIQYFPRENRLTVTILDAKDLPSMDANGMADPYVEVSIRPQGSSKRFQTTVKTKCLNPIFNQSFDFVLSESVWNDPQSALLLKLKDKDIGTADDLIGIVRIPLDMLDLKQIKTYNCLLLDHGKSKGNNDIISSADAAKLNLKISELTGTVYDLEQQNVSLIYFLIPLFKS